MVINWMSGSIIDIVTTNVILIRVAIVEQQLQSLHNVVWELHNVGLCNNSRASSLALIQSLENVIFTKKFGLQLKECVQCEGNDDLYAVAMKKLCRVVGHVPRMTSILCHLFLSSGGLSVVTSLA